MKFQWKKYKLELEQPFVLSYGAFQFRFAYIITLEDQGHIGYGEATAVSYYGWTEELIEAELTRLQSEFEVGLEVSHLLHSLELAPPTRNALNCAWVDLQARIQNKTLCDFFDIDSKLILPVSSITITGNAEAILHQQIQQHDWPVYKIKMGTREDDMKLRLMHQYPEKKFRIDANTGWNLDWIKTHAELLNQNNIELIEQPFPVEQPEFNRVLKDYVQAPVIADESCQHLQDIPACADYFDGVNVKLMKCGGWHQCLDIIANARQHDLLLMLGCMTETSIGISHAIQLVRLVDFADVDGAYLLANDPAKGSYLDAGQIIESTTGGSGVVELS